MTCAVVVVASHVKLIACPVALLTIVNGVSATCPALLLSMRASESLLCCSERLNESESPCKPRRAGVCTGPPGTASRCGTGWRST